MSAPDVKLAVVIVHFNTSDDLDRLLDSLVENPPRCSCRVVVVDNASRDPGLAAVRERHAECDWVLSGENLGYARGCNLGLARVAAEYALILNPDIVVRPGALDALIAFADAHPRAGIVGPQLLNDDGSIQDSCRRFYTFSTLLMRRTFLGRLFPCSPTVARHLMRDFDHRTSRPVDWVLGGCLLARRTAVARIGPLDERFFLYFEDVDWCFRMWQGGWEVLYTSDAQFDHRHRRDSARGLRSRSFWLHLGSLISFYEKWGLVVYVLKKWRGPLSVVLLWIFDLLLLSVAFPAAYLLRTVFDSRFSEPLYPLSEYRPLFLFSLLLATVTFGLLGRYRPARLREPPRIWAHLQQTATWALLLLASSYLGQQQVVSRAVLLLFLVLAVAFTAAGEAGYRWLVRRMERGRFTLERSLLVGARDVVASWLEQSLRDGTTGIDAVGWISTSTNAAGAAGEAPLAGGEVPWLGGWSDLPELVERLRVSQVVFWDEPGSVPERWRVLAALRRRRLKLRWQGDAVWLVTTGARPELYADAPSAVVEPGTGAALVDLVLRGAGLISGLMLGVLAVPGWAWLRSRRLPRGDVRLERLEIVTGAGDRTEVTIAADRSGRVLALPWQWSLAGSLLRGELDLWGLRPTPLEEPETAGARLDWWKTWRSGLRGPGLYGPWLLDVSASDAPRSGDRIGRAFSVLRRAWRHPGGWDRLPLQAAAADEPTAANEGIRDG
jgi:GT2 family glycosyltransferase